MKKVLVVHYSQTGQLRRATDAFVAALRQANDVRLVDLALEPVEDYPFPWPVGRFFDAFPEAVHLDAPPLKPFAIDDSEDFDLVILCYQVWFLAPSLPVTAFLQSAAGRRLLQDKPVITLTACRNMWLMAQEQVKRMLDDAGARLLDHVALVDRGPAMLTFYTTPRWLLTGYKGSAGISDADITLSRRFGESILHGLRHDAERDTRPLLAGLQAVTVNEHLMMSERIGYRSFRIWGRLVRAAGPPGSWRRKPVLAIYAVFLVGMILTVVPLSAGVRTLLRPLLRRRLAAQRQYFEQPSGSLDFNMKDAS